MKNILLALTFLFVSSGAFAQAESDFITIVGQSSIVFEPVGISIKFKIEEVERNEYQKIQAREFSDVKMDVENHLEGLGYKLSDAKEMLPRSGSYNKKISESFQMIIKSVSDVKLLKETTFSGFSITEVTYAYDNTINIDDKKLAEKAITDAKRKANSLASFVGKSVGTVRSISDRSYSKLAVPATNSKDEYVLKYDVTITFDLLD